MADELDDFITALTGHLEEMTGIRDAPEHLLEAINEFPTVISYFVSGHFEYGAGSPCIGVHRVQADVHLGRSVLPEDEAAARLYILRGLVKLAANVTMDGTCAHCLLRDYEIGRIGYGGAETFGVRYILEVKIKHEGVTVSA